MSAIKEMVNRFLVWKLPKDFRPDAGISFKAEFNKGTPWPMKHEPSGTNLFTADQATEMLEYVAGPILAEQQAEIVALKKEVSASGNDIKECHKRMVEKNAEIVRLTSDRDAKSTRMWELGKECDALQERLSTANAEIALLKEASDFDHSEYKRLRKEQHEQLSAARELLVTATYWIPTGHWLIMDIEAFLKGEQS